MSGRNAPTEVLSVGAFRPFGRSVHAAPAVEKLGDRQAGATQQLLCRAPPGCKSGRVTTFLRGRQPETGPSYSSLRSAPKPVAQDQIGQQRRMHSAQARHRGMIELVAVGRSVAPG